MSTKNYFFQNGLLVLLKNLIFKTCMNEIINNVKYKKYFESSLEITGPGLLSNFISKKFSLGKYIYDDKNELHFYKYKNKYIIQNKCFNCSESQDWTNGNNYGILFENKQIYNDFKIKEQIPKIIHKTGPNKLYDLPDDLLKLFDNTKKMNKEYKINYYDNDDCYNLIKENFEPDVLWAYETLIPTAYKADLFRYCVLYLYGGIYSDLTQQFLIPFNDIIDFHKDTLILTEDLIATHYTYTGIQISFICCIPKLKIFKQCIDNIIINCDNLYYGKTSLDITGPYLFKHTLNTIDINYIIKLYQSHAKGGYLVDNIDKQIIKTKLSNHNKILYNKINIHYGHLWKIKNVFDKKNTKKYGIITKIENPYIKDSYSQIQIIHLIIFCQ